MKYLYTFCLSLLMSLVTFSQVITFECNNEIITVSFNDIANDFNAYIDWNGDGEINEDDYIIYLSQVYDCDIAEFEDEDWGNDDENNDFGDMFTFECNGEEITIEITDINNFTDYESYIESILSDYECEEWDIDDEENSETTTWNDIDWIVSDWEDFDWVSVWEDFDLANTIDWDMIPWDEIIDLGILPEDLIEYIISISGGQPFNWNDFVTAQGGCEDDDTTISMGLSIWTDVSGCAEAYSYLETQGLDCLSDLNLPFVSADPISLISICCETCQDEISIGCTDPNGCNYNPFATNDDGSCDYSCFGCTDIAACNYNENAIIDNGSCDYSSCGGCMDEGACNFDPFAVIDDGYCDYSCIGCMDSTACNYDETATIPSECDYGVECFVSPCSVSESPGIDGAYCVDDYCQGCCALWYYSDGTLISNSCDITDDNPAIGLWNDFENDQYIEITEDVIGFYTYIEDEGFMCWYYWAMEYTYIGNGLMEVIDPEYGSVEIQGEILDNGNLQILDPEGEVITLSPLEQLPTLDMCDLPNQGCEGFQGQWIYFYPGTEIEVIWMEIDPLGVDFFILLDNNCVEYIPLSYDSIEGSDECELFAAEYDGFEFGQLSLNSDGTLSFSNMPGFPEDWPEIWNPGDFNTGDFVVCSYGCTDPNACNYDPFANSDDGTCGLVDDCGDCQIPYCYDMMTNGVEYISEEACDGVWIGNDCDNNEYCLSSPLNPYWNAGCVSIEENLLQNSVKYITNMMGQTINSNINSGFRVVFYNDGSVHKKHLIK